MSKKIIILGAGYAGVEAALTLQKKKKRNEDIEICLIDKNSYHTLFTHLHEVAGNRIAQDNAVVSLQKIFQYTDVKVIKDEISEIDMKNNKLVSSLRAYEYDYLILAAGSQLDSHGVSGVKEYAYSISSYAETLKLKDHINDVFAMAAYEKNEEKRKSLLTIVIGGGGFAGIEAAGDIAQRIPELCLEYGISRNDVKLMVVEAKSDILNDMSEPNVKKSLNYLTKKLKVEVLTDSEIVEVDEGLVLLKNGRHINTNTLIWTAGIKIAEILENLDINSNKKGRIKVDAFTGTQYPNVYAVGDAALYKYNDYNLPALYKYAVQSGRIAAINVLADCRQKEKQKRILQPKLYGMSVTMGSFFAAGSFLGMRLPAYIMVLVDYLATAWYLFRIGGFELALNSLLEEFQNKKQKKFLLEEHYSRKVTAFWLVPLRLFLGYAWLMEGINKIGEGWFTKAILAGSLTDGETGASASETGEKVFRIVAEHTPDWYAWIANTIVVPNALIFQFVIVLTELLLGLALISGTFTFMAALVAIGLNINFLISTGMMPHDYWYIPAAICMMAGAGRSFGVDHYLMPYLMRQWRYFIRRKSIKLWLWN